MNDYQVYLQIHEDYGEQVDGDALRQSAVQALRMTEATAPAGLSLVITNNETVQALNNQFRNIDAPTDVLSFASDSDPHVLDPGEPPYLGDILITFPVAAQQAEESGHGVQEELCFLTVHGVLHLLGHDHHTPDEQAEMWALQSTILDTLRESAR